MDAAGVAITLSIVAYNLIRKSRAFKARMNGQTDVFDNLIAHCQTVREDADSLEEEIEEAKARGAATEFRWVIKRVAELKTLITEFDAELGEFCGNSATTTLGRALLQLKIDVARPRIEEISKRIRFQYQSLTVLLQIALSKLPSPIAGPPTALPSRATPMTPPPSPTKPEPDSPQRTRSDLSGRHSNPALEIQAAVRGGKIKKVVRLLEEDPTGNLIHVLDASDRTLVDISISSGTTTGGSQVILVEELMNRGVKFTMVKDIRLTKLFHEVCRVISYTIKRRKSSASSTVFGPP